MCTCEATAQIDMHRKVTTTDGYVCMYVSMYEGMRVTVRNVFDKIQKSPGNQPF